MVLEEFVRAAGAARCQIIAVCTDAPATTTAVVELVKESFGHAQVFARSFDRRHALTLFDRDVDYQRRETFDSALTFGREALVAMGTSADEANEIGQLEVCAAGALTAARFMDLGNGNGDGNGGMGGGPVPGGGPVTGGFEVLLAAGLFALDQGDVALAAQTLGLAADADPFRRYEAMRALSRVAEVSGNPEDAQAFMQEAMSDAEVTAARFEAAMEVLRAQDGVDPERTAAIGYCMGGAVVLGMARRGADLDAVVSFHGSLGTAEAAAEGAVKSKVLVCTGADDPFVRAPGRDEHREGELRGRRVSRRRPRVHESGRDGEGRVVRAPPEVRRGSGRRQLEPNAGPVRRDAPGVRCWGAKSRGVRAI